MNLFRTGMLCLALCSGVQADVYPNVSHAGRWGMSLEPLQPEPSKHHRISALQEEWQRNFRLIEQMVHQAACNGNNTQQISYEEYRNDICSRYIFFIEHPVCIQQLPAQLWMWLVQEYNAIQHYEQHIREQALYETACQRVFAQRQAEALQTKAYQEELRLLEQQHHHIVTTPIKHQVARRKALQQAQRNPSRSQRTFAIDGHTRIFALQYDIANLEQGMMNEYEHQLHSEFIDQLATAAQLQKQYHALSRSSIFLDTLGYSVAIGVDENKNHHTAAATYWADYSWQVLDLLKAAGEGCILGLQNSTDIVLRPIDTIKGAIHGIVMLTASLANATGTVLCASISDNPQRTEKLNELVENIEAVIVHCSKQLSSLSTRDKIKYAAAYATEFFIPDKAFKMAQKLCTSMKPIIRALKVAQIGEKRQSLIGTCRASLANILQSPAIQEASQIGKTIGVATEISIELLKEFHTNFIKTVKQEIAILKPMFDDKINGFAEFANKYVKLDYAHILGMELIFDSKGIPKLSGFHHDFMQTVENSGMIKFVNKVMGEHGFYQVDLIIHGKQFPKTFFPAYWPREKVVNVIYEAYENCIKIGKNIELCPDGKYRLLGCTQEGVSIEMFITKKARIITAYPLI